VRSSDLVDAKEMPTDLTRRRNVTTSVDVSCLELSLPGHHRISILNWLSML